MGKRRPSGDGMVRKRPDGRWEGRIVVGHKADGSSIFRYLYADTQKELTTKLRQNIDAYQGGGAHRAEQNDAGPMAGPMEHSLHDRGWFAPIPWRGIGGTWTTM